MEQGVDQIFFTDLPTTEEREEIFKIHLKAFDRDPDKYNTKQFAIATKDFTGSDIEAVVGSALYKAFYRLKLANKEEIKDLDSDLTDQDLLETIADTIPFGESNAEIVKSIRQVGMSKGTPASKAENMALTLVDSKPKSGQVIEI